MRLRAIVLALITAAMTAFLAVAGSSLAAPSQAQTGGKVKVRIAGGPKNGKDVTNGGVVGRGLHGDRPFTDQGRAVTYRTVKGNLAAGNAVITLSLVTTGKKGAITFLVKIVVKPTTTTSRWTIASGTKAYKGLSGKGTERENADHTIVTLTEQSRAEARLTLRLRARQQS